MAGSDRYKNYQWIDVEPQLRSAWDKVRDAVRYGTEGVTGCRRH